MRANIFRHEFRIRRKSVLIWSISMIALLFFFFSIYPSFADQAALTNQLMSKFPPALLAAFGLNTIDLSTVSGFFGFLFVFVQLCLAIQAGNYGFGLVSIEENERTADFLLTKPVSRIKVLNSKLLAVLSSLLITELIVWSVSLLTIAIFHGSHEVNWHPIILILASMIIFQVFFLSVGIVISLLVKRVRSVTPYSLGLAFGTYTLNAFSGIFGDVKLEYITPFKQFDPIYIVQHQAYDLHLLLINVAVSVISIGVSYWLYIRRDVPAVS